MRESSRSDGHHFLARAWLPGEPHHSVTVATTFDEAKGWADVWLQLGRHVEIQEFLDGETRRRWACVPSGAWTDPAAP
jgi:hypothetical protein